MTALAEEPCVFDCAGEQLVGVFHGAETPAKRAVVIVVGGPQYRVGSHRQFLLLARHLAANGVPVLRFDYRGMGDSGGEWVDWENVGPDIRAAIDALIIRIPGVSEVVIWGLCDGASAALLYAHSDERVAGLVLANPWVRTQETLAQTYVSHYYGARLAEREFWAKLLTGKLDIRASAAEFGRSVLATFGLRSERPRDGEDNAAEASTAREPFPERMRRGLEYFAGPVLFVLSGEDLTASEFRILAEKSPRWQPLMRGKSVQTEELANANHTFSRREWRDRVAEVTLRWLQSW